MKSFNVRIAPSRLSGCVTAPPSKSISHRALICAALAQGEGVISNLAFSEDILATVDALTAIGARFEKLGEDTVRVSGIGGRPRALDILNCRESGSTLRFMIPICLLSPDEFRLTGTEKLLSRPLGVYSDIFKVRYCPPDGNILTLKSGEPIGSGEYRIDGGISSQFITGLLFALPLADGDSRIIVEGSFESASYVDLTLDSLARFGIKVKREDNIFYIKGNQKYAPADVRIEGDASNAAFFEALNLLGSSVSVAGLNPQSKQGDMAFKRHFEALKCRSDAPIDLSDCPDLAPILFTAAAFLGGGIFTHTDRLRLKESDRISAMKEELQKLGARIEALDGIDGGTVRILPAALHPPSIPLSSHNDHRIAMAAAIATTVASGPITILGAECVAKSYPAFWPEYRRLGGNYEQYIR
jgi:3-phosphoshikimate 1-carboxyvinyltransferase